MLAFIERQIEKIENEAQFATQEEAMAALRCLGLDDFGAVLFSMPNPAWPRLSALLPRMAGEEAQLRWTGASGQELLRRSSVFVRSVSYNYAKLTGKTLAGANILDFGCGWGRLARLFYYFVPMSAFVGVDPMEESHAECRAAGLGSMILRSQYLPLSLPISPVSIDLAYAFSVFTHTSERATVTCLAAIRQTLKLGGILCLTIRPQEYWDQGASPVSLDVAAGLKDRHRVTGFAFTPHALPPVDGDLTYGDTSMSLEWLQDHAAGYALAGIDRSLDDPYQPYVYLKAV
jgi:SAM-dependent methyltransferase